MTQPAHKLAIVIPTIGREAELRRMLTSLVAQTRRPDQVIIVDEDGCTRASADEFPQLDITVIVLPGSASAKRNAGPKAARPETTLIGFMDDDIVLGQQAIENLLRFWETAMEGLGGTSLNWANAPALFAARLKSLRLTSRLGLYQRGVGMVLPSGFHTHAANLPQSAYVQWLPSGAVVFLRKVLEEFCFDEWFAGYGYLEDLDFSSRVGKKYRLAVVADAHFYHYPSRIGRPSGYLFGKKEVLNRLYFVSKHRELSPFLCCLALSVRGGISMFLGLTRLDGYSLWRLAGNIAGFLSVLRHGDLLCVANKSV